jgi:hypothetical protein
MGDDRRRLGGDPLGDFSLADLPQYYLVFGDEPFPASSSVPRRAAIGDDDVGNVDDRRLAAGRERAGEIDEPRVCGRVRGRDQYPVGVLVLSLPLLAEGRVGVDEWDVRPARGAA